MARKIIRYDSGTLRSPRTTPQGYILADGFASRLGVQTYRLRDGSTRRELRLPEDVFAPASLAGFEGIPVTDDHPSEMLDAKSTKKHWGGTVLGAGRADGNFVAVPMSINDADLISKVKSGKRQLSVGYTVELDMQGGVHPVYGEYDAIQRNIVPNHLAVVDAGRAGPAASIKMDSEDHADAGVSIVAADMPWMTYASATLCVYSRTLSLDALVAKLTDLLSTVPNVTIEDVVSDHRDRLDQDPDMIVGLSGAACAMIVTSEMSTDELDAKIRPLLAGEAAMTLGKPSPVGDARRKRDENLTAEQRANLAASSFAVPAREGLPINDPDHVRGAMARFGQYEFQDAAEKRAAYNRIVARAHHFGIDTKGFEDEWSGKLDSSTTREVLVRDLQGAGSVPRSRSNEVEPTVNLDQALAALNAANEKLGAEKLRADQAEAARQKAETDAVNARKDAEQAQKALDAAKADHETKLAQAKKDADDRRDSDVADRVDVLTKANEILGAVDKDKKPIDRSAMSSRAIKVEVCKAVDGDDYSDEKQYNDTYVGAMFDGAVKRSRNARGSAAGARVALDGARQQTPPQIQPSTADREAAAKEKLRNDTASAWMPKEGN